MPTETPHETRHPELGGHWYGWDSPVGLGVLVLSLALSIAAVLAALSLSF